MNISEIEKQIAALTSQLKLIKAEQEAKDLHTIGGLIRHLRVRKGLKQKDVALKANIAGSAVCHAEKTRSNGMKVSSLLGVLTALEVTPVEFFSLLEKEQAEYHKIKIETPDFRAA